MGSTVIASPAIKYTVDQLGKEQVFFLIFERNKEGITLLNLLSNRNVITIDDSSFLRFIVSTTKALIFIWKANIGITVDLEIFSRCTVLLSLLSRASKRIGLSTYRDEGLYRGDLFTKEVLYSPHHHMSVVYQSLVESALTETQVKSDLVPLKRKISVESFLPIAEISTDTRSKIDHLFKQFALEGKDLIVLNPDPGLLPLRGWPVENFSKLATRILAELPDVVVIVTGVKRAKLLAQEILSGLPSDRAVDLTGATDTVEELLGLLARCRFMVTIDSGPAHLAALVRLPRVVLFGPETPSLYAPLGEEVSTIFMGLCCSPCFSAANHRTSVCKDNVCMKSISADDVFAVVQRALR